MQYKLRLRTMAGGISWEHDFDIASEPMAVEYCQRQLSQAYNLPISAMGADLFCLAPEGHVASFVTKTEQRVIRQ